MAERVQRGEIWTVAGGQAYISKPRPALIVQDDRFRATDSVTICPFTSDPTDAPIFRLPVEPTGANGLQRSSKLMVDKITTVRRSRMGVRLGHLRDEDLVRFNRAVLVFLGIA